MEIFGTMKEDFLREFLELPHGVPCHEAYSRLFRLMKPTSFQAFFDKFRADFAAGCGEEAAIATDGKEMRRSFDKAMEESPLNIQLKGNQGDMLADVQAFVEDQNTDFIDEYTATDAGHGRIEERAYRVYDVPNYLVERHGWPHLPAAGRSAGLRSGHLKT